MNEMLSKLVSFRSGPSTAIWSRAQKVVAMTSKAGVTFEWFEGRGMGYTRQTMSIARKDIPKFVEALLAAYNKYEQVEAVGKPLLRSVKKVG